jgi:hypothetical protein
MKKSVTFAFLGLALLLALALPASADILATGTREAFSSDINTAGYTTLALDDAGNTTLNFNSGSGPIQIAYSAECALNVSASLVVLQIFVDGVAIGPGSGTAWRFCSSTEYTNVTRIVAPSVSSGAHTLQIKASGNAKLRHTVTTISD